MSNVVVNGIGSVIEHDEIVYHDKPKPDPEPKPPEPEKECCCDKTYTVVLHFH